MANDERPEYLCPPAKNAWIAVVSRSMAMRIFEKKGDGLK